MYNYQFYQIHHVHVSNMNNHIPEVVYSHKNNYCGTLTSLEQSNSL